MKKSGWAALCAAGVLVSAGSASADLVRYDVNSGFYYITGPKGWFDAPLCPHPVGVNACVQVHGVNTDSIDFSGALPLTMSFTIDTELGELVEGATLATFFWSAADGPSPLTDGSFNWPVTGINTDFGGLTNISLYSHASGTAIVFGGPNFSLSLGLTLVSAVPNLTEDATMTSPYANFGSNFAIGDYSGYYSNYGRLTITNLGPSPGSVPEPSTWVMLILGFFGLGASLRRRRAALIGAQRA